MRTLLLGLVVISAAVGPVALRANARPDEPTTPRANARSGELHEFAKFLLNHLAGKVLDLAFDAATGKPDTRDLQQQLEYLAQRDAANANAIYDLKRQLAGCATRDEVKTALSSALQRIDAKLAEHAARLHELEKARRELEKQQAQLEAQQAQLYKELGTTRAELAGLTKTVGGIAQQVQNHDRRLTAVEAELAELKSWDNAEVSMRLAVAGADLIEKGSYADAIKYLTQAHAYSPENPGVPYVLGIAHHLSGKDELADLWIARGIAAERQKIPALWFINVHPRYQGQLRTWFDSRRYDPILGRKATGNVRVVEYTSAGPMAVPTAYK